MVISDRFLVTGFSGFVSKHFLDFLESEKKEVHIVGVDLYPPSFDIKNFNYVKCDFLKVDLLNKAELEKVIAEFKPNYVLHLASFSSVALSWKKPVESFTNNTNIFLNLIETIHSLNLKCRILSVGSSEEYGNVNESELPLKETHALKPNSPYAVARVSQEMLSKVYADSFGLDIVMTRSFNHIGAYQKDIFVVSSFAKQLTNLKNITSEIKEISTGDTSVIRDFVDVRDVVKAYYLLFKKGKAGEVYNICSGKGISLNDVIQIMASILDMSVVQTVDNQLVRPNDIRKIIGSNEKIKLDTGWNNAISIEQSLNDILEYYK
jgi:GDP-4-dehydro-6-deoxy-D-mannose reductase